MPILKNPKQYKCKNCGEPFFKNNSTQIVCSTSCAIQLSKEKEAVKRAKEERKQLNEMKIEVYSKENKKYLQNEINKLSRMIDARFGFETCIDCDKPFGKQCDAAHYHGRGSNSSLRYHLDNLHSASSQCNMWSDKHKEGYKIGLEQRYGSDYANYVINELPVIFKEIHLSAKEIHEKLKLVRKLIRDFDTMRFNSSISARTILNQLIGIYEN